MHIDEWQLPTPMTCALEHCYEESDTNTQYLPPPRRIRNRRCLSVCLLATLFQNFETDCMKFSRKVGNVPGNKWFNFGGDPDHHLDTEIVFRIRQCWKVVSTDCAARCCSARHALAGIAVATMAPQHQPTTDSGTDIQTLIRRALVELCTVQCFYARR